MAKKKEIESTGIPVLDDLIQEFGEGVFIDGSHLVDSEIKVVPISPVIDNLAGGGVKWGSFCIFTGPPKVGKTSLALNIAANALNDPEEDGDLPRRAYIMNVEGRLSKRDLMGIDTLRQHVIDKRLTIVGSRPGKILSGEENLKIAERLINEHPGCILILDSFSQLCSKSGREKEWDGKAFRDDMPNFLSLFCKRISNVIPINKSIFIGITHQIADTGFGFSSWAEASGNKIQYQVDLKLKASHKTPWLENGMKIGQEVHWECLCSPLLNGACETKATSKLRYGYGIDSPSELILSCLDMGIIKKGGAWYSYEPLDIKVQGLEKMRSVLLEQEGLYDKLNAEYRGMMEYDSV